MNYCRTLKQNTYVIAAFRNEVVQHGNQFQKHKYKVEYLKKILN